MRRTLLLFPACGLFLCLTGCGTTTQIVRPITVAKSGRTTGLTCSTVDAMNRATSVAYTTNCDGTGTQFTVNYTNQVSVVGGDFSSAGDSGSLIVTQNNANPLALLYADSSTDTVGNPVSDVLSFFAFHGHPVNFAGAARTAPVIGCTLPGPQAAMAARLAVQRVTPSATRSEEHTSELQSRLHLVCRLLL